MQQRQLTLINGASSVTMTPPFFNTNGYKWERINEDGKYYYKKSLTLDVTFVKEDFQYLYAIEESGQGCVELILEVAVVNGKDLYLEYRGKLRLVDMQFDLDKCTITGAVKPVTYYDCIDKNADTEYNVLDNTIGGALPRKSIYLMLGTIETLDLGSTDSDSYGYAFSNNQLPDLTDHKGSAFWFTTGLPAQGLWSFYKVMYRVFHKPDKDTDESVTGMFSSWVREVVILDNGVVPPDGFAFVETDAATNKPKYAKYVSIREDKKTTSSKSRPCGQPVKEDVNSPYNIKRSDAPGTSNDYQLPIIYKTYDGNILHLMWLYRIWSHDGDIFGNPYYPQVNYDEVSVEWDYVGASGNTTITTAIPFDDMINKTVNLLCDNMQFESEFFHAQTNYVTGLPNDLMNLYFIQKSDAKLPDASNKATKGIMKFSDLMKSLRCLFDVRYFITYDKQQGLYIFHLEHISFFTKAVFWNITGIGGGKWLVGKRKYSYDISQMPKQETFKCMEAQGLDFIGKPIVYNSACVNDNSDSTTPYEAPNITTDLQLILNSNDEGTSDNNNAVSVSNDGWALVQCKSYNRQLYVSQVQGIFDAPRLNNTLSFAYLHPIYHLHERALLVGNMNSQDTNFKTAKRTKLGVEVSVPFCIADMIAFAPDQLITGVFGDAEIKEATYSNKTDMITLSLLYDANFNIALSSYNIEPEDDEEDYFEAEDSDEPIILEQG